MTIPGGVGYPDWLRSFATARFFELPAFATTITQETDYGPFTVANLDSILIQVFALTGHGQISLRWFQDEALSQFICSDNISLRETARFIQSVVVKGPFLQIRASNVEPADWTISVVLSEVTRSVIPQGDFLENVLFSSSAVAVGAGANVDTIITRIWAGEARWVPTSSLTAFQASLDAIDHNGNITNIDFMNQLRTGDSRELYLPSCTLRLRLSNNTGAAGNIGCRITARPGLSGF